MLLLVIFGTPCICILSNMYVNGRHFSNVCAYIVCMSLGWAAWAARGPRRSRAAGACGRRTGAWRASGGPTSGRSASASATSTPSRASASEHHDDLRSLLHNTNIADFSFQPTLMSGMAEPWSRKYSSQSMSLICNVSNKQTVFMLNFIGKHMSQFK